MTHPQYSAQSLAALPISQIKEIARSLGCTPEGDLRLKQNWINEIVEFQGSAIAAEREFNEYLDQQVEEVAPEKLELLRLQGSDDGRSGMEPRHTHPVYLEAYERQRSFYLAQLRPIPSVAVEEAAISLDIPYYDPKDDVIVVQWETESSGSTYNLNNGHSYRFRVLGGQIQVLIGEAWVRQSRANTKHHRAIEADLALQKPQPVMVQLESRMRDLEGIPEDSKVIEVPVAFGDVLGAVVAAGYSLSEWRIAEHWHPVEACEF